ncbi:Glyceraldehyde-3-phosphate dehydrogenase [compost metagenome]
MAILNLTLEKSVSKAEINDALKYESFHGELVEQIEFSISDESVSSDMIGNSHASIVDGPATIVSKDGKSVVLYVWYDNEYGYTRQVIRLAKHISGVIRLRYY